MIRPPQDLHECSPRGLKVPDLFSAFYFSFGLNGSVEEFGAMGEKTAD